MTKPKKREPNPSAIPQEILDELLKAHGGAERLFEKGGLLDELKKRLVERALQGELSAHLGYDRYDARPEGTSNTRNGSSSKTMQTDSGAVEIEVPRDREASFEPVLIKKRQTRLSGFDDKVLALYARGMTTRDIRGHLEELYGVEVSPDLISRVTDAVQDDVVRWQTRPLESIYAVLYLDALVTKVRYQGMVRNRSVFLALGIGLDGRKEVLGMWIEPSEGASGWVRILTELQNRGVEDILIVCCDGLKGFPQAIESVFPKSTVQSCVVHMVRNSLRYVSWKERKAVAADLRAIYTAANREEARLALEAFEEKWDAVHPAIGKSWRAQWERIVPFLDFPPEIRKLIYTTNAIESLHSRLRKLTHHRGHFPSDEALLKVLYLALSRFHKSWNNREGSWLTVLHRLIRHFPGRVPEV